MMVPLAHLLKFYQKRVIVPIANQTQELIAIKLLVSATWQLAHQSNTSHLMVTALTAIINTGLTRIDRDAFKILAQISKSIHQLEDVKTVPRTPGLTKLKTNASTTVQLAKRLNS